MNLSPIPLKNVKITDGFWFDKQKTNRETTLQIEYENCLKTGHIESWKLLWENGAPKKPMFYWDSDLAKLIEAVGYSAEHYPDQNMQKHIDDVIDDMEKAQRHDGYLNVFFTVVEPDKRWTNLRDYHELYCAGHLIEAAIAYFKGTGKRKLLDIVCRYADYIDSVFGPEPDKLKGYPGHEEIELALVKLAEATGNEKYLKLAKFFIDQRGQQPFYFDEEAIRRGDKPTAPFNADTPREDRYKYLQAHKPVREQDTADGHAVRAAYLFTGMADVARATHDNTLLDACRKLWDNIVTRRMYITGGIGSSRFGECFTFDYDLPNEEAYAETCAAIALCFFANAMLRIDQDAQYADVFEQALYNGVISGISPDGKQFFYDNVLASFPPEWIYNRQKPNVRQDWYGCACCPPNIARLLASLDSYIYMIGNDSDGTDTLFVNHFIASSTTCDVNGKPFSIKQTTRYPWNENVRIDVETAAPEQVTIAVRIPGWCRNTMLSVNGETVDLAAATRKGYAYLTRVWNQGDTIDITLEMPVERIYANPNVRHDAGKVALRRGPVVFCFEECDNGPRLADVHLPPAAELTLVKAPAPLGDVPAIRTRGLRPTLDGWNNTLYATTRPNYEPVELTAIPYFLWGNREHGAMQIWTLE